jgi:uncharacterized BrkB/YihY/UPF0761 family membrane protein
MFMIAGLLVGLVLSWSSAMLLDWLFDIEEFSYAILTLPLCALIGLVLFSTGFVMFLLAIIRHRRNRQVNIDEGATHT